MGAALSRVAPGRPAPWAGPLLILPIALGIAGGIGFLAGLSGIFALVVGLVVVLSVAILLRAHLGVWLLCLLLPLAQVSLMPRQLLGVTGLSPVNALLAATLLAVLLHYAWRRLQGQSAATPLPLPAPLVWLYVVPIALAALNGMQSVHLIPDYYRTVVRAIQFDSPLQYLRDAYVRPMLLVLFALMVAAAFRDLRRPAVLPAAGLCGALLLAALVFLVVVFSGGDLSLLASATSRSFLSGTGLHANELGLMLNMALAMTLFSARGADGALRLALLAATALLAAAVLLTFSRGGYLGLLLIYSAFLVHVRNPRALLVSVFIGVCAAAMVPDAVYDRLLLGIAAGDRSAISAGRIDDIWLPLLPSVGERLAFGSGLMSILWSAPALKGQLTVAQPHNAYLGLLLDTGLIGFVLIMAFHVWAWRLIRRSAALCDDRLLRGFFHGAALTVPLLLVQGISDDRFTPTVPQTFMWLAIGAALGAHARQRGAERKSGPGTAAPAQAE